MPLGCSSLIERSSESSWRDWTRGGQKRKKKKKETRVMFVGLIMVICNVSAKEK